MSTTATSSTATAATTTTASPTVGTSPETIRTAWRWVRWRQRGGEVDSSSVQEQQNSGKPAGSPHLGDRHDTQELDAPPQQPQQTQRAQQQEEDHHLQHGGAPRTHDEDPDFVLTPLTRRQFAVVYSALLVAYFMAILDETLVSTALKAVVRDLGRQELVSWVGGAYQMMVTSAALLSGYYADLAGRKWLLIGATAFFQAGSLVCGIATSMEMLIVGRAVAGIGGGGILSVVAIIVTDIVSIRDRGKYQGQFAAAYAAASILGPLVGGAFADRSLWRWSFYLNLPIGAANVYAVIAYYKVDTGGRGRGSTVEALVGKVDVAGSVMVVVAVVAFMVPLQLGGTLWEWASPQTIALFVAAAATTVALVVVERRAARPAVPPGFFKTWTIVWMLVIAFCVGLLQVPMIYYISLYFQISLNYSAFDTGLRFLVLLVGGATSAIGTGLLVSRYGRYIPLIHAGAFLTLASLITFTFLATSASPMPVIVQLVLLLALGAGGGSFTQTRMLGIQASVSIGDQATAVALSLFAATLASAV
ncbi:major facilitator superfamily domain-containing protein, partial [Zopfochytrium polystomum]